MNLLVFTVKIGWRPKNDRFCSVLCVIVRVVPATGDDRYPVYGKPESDPDYCLIYSRVSENN